MPWIDSQPGLQGSMLCGVEVLLMNQQQPVQGLLPDQLFGIGGGCERLRQGQSSCDGG